MFLTSIRKFSVLLIESLFPGFAEIFNISYFRFRFVYLVPFS